MEATLGWTLCRIAPQLDSSCCLWRRRLATTCSMGVRVAKTVGENRVVPKNIIDFSRGELFDSSLDNLSKMPNSHAVASPTR